MRASEALAPVDTGAPPLREGSGRRLSAVAAWSFLALADLVVNTAGFHRLHRIVGGFPLRGRATEVARVTHRWCEAVNRARVYYPKRAWCLQSAAATVCILRLHGVPAELVIGVRKLPFLAHAWVEVERRVVMNAQAEMDTLYREISRW